MGAVVDEQPPENPGVPRPVLVVALVLCGLLDDLGVSLLGPVAAISDHFELLGYLTLGLFMAVWGGAVLWWKLSGGSTEDSKQVVHRT